jgi:hypothetical protein
MMAEMLILVALTGSGYMSDVWTEFCAMHKITHYKKNGKNISPGDGIKKAFHAHKTLQLPRYV